MFFTEFHLPLKVLNMAAMTFAIDLHAKEYEYDNTSFQLLKAWALSSLRGANQTHLVL